MTGTYKSSIPSPTNLPADVSLTAHGVEQAHELATYFASVSNPRISRVYSSPYYRCLQTIQPTVDKLGLSEILGDTGLGEWYGDAPFTHPSPAPPEVLHALFSAYSLTRSSSIIPSANGETILELHNRCAYALSYIISSLDREVGDEEVAIVICTHAASLIAMGRALTGLMPRDVNEGDFRPFTCGVSKFVRQTVEWQEVRMWNEEKGVPDIGWRGRGVGGGWDCVMNGSCEHLNGGEERGW